MVTDGKWRNLIALGHAARRNGRLEEALAHYRAALRSAPDSADANSIYGLMLLHLNRVDEAAAPLKRAVDIDPSHPEGRMNLAELHARQGDVASAIRVVETLASEIPQFWWIWDKLGELKVRAGRLAEAAAHYGMASERKQDDPSLLFKWARATFESGSPAEAKAILDKAARLAPGHEAILRLYAEIHEGNADWENLARTAQSWVRTQPQNPLPWMFAARAQWEAGYLTQAMESYRTFLDRGGRSATNLATYGRLCMKALAYGEASRALDEAEGLDAECGHMLSAKATLAMFRGEFQDALAYARRAIDVDPRDTAAFKVLVQVSGGRIAEGEHAQLERLSEDSGLRPQDRISASFALADILDAQGNTEAAFAAYVHANELCAQRARHERLDYDRAERERQTDELISRFPAAAPSRQTNAGPIPIFIVGMPRSGTTLIESIIGAHSRVFACGERQEMRSIMQEFASLAPSRRDGRHSGIHQAAVARGILARAARSARSHRRRRQEPVELRRAGAHSRTLPPGPGGSRPAGSGRDRAVDLRNEFPKFVSFAHRLDDIGHYYGEYARLMSHWQEVLGNRFMTIQYEDLVADFASALPELLQYCGLEWEEACRDFSTAKRVIATMSAVQARRPLAEFGQGRSGSLCPASFAADRPLFAPPVSISDPAPSLRIVRRSRRFPMRPQAAAPRAPPVNAFKPDASAVIISRSGGVSCGCQMSNISTTRSRSLSFQASCSIVSSNTHA